MIHIIIKICDNCFMKTKLLYLLTLPLLLSVTACNSNKNKSNSNSLSESGNAFARDELVDAPNTAQMNRTGYDRIVEYLNVNSDTIQSLYDGKYVYLNKRAQINKEGEATGAALYVQKIKNEVAQIYQTYPTSYLFNFNEWDAKNVWEDEPIVFYYYKTQGFIKAKVEVTDDTYYKVEKAYYIFYDDTGVKEKEEYRWIVTSSDSGDGATLFDCQLRVRYSFKNPNSSNSDSTIW